MFWLILLGAVGGVWLFAIGVLALVDGDVGMKQKKSIVPVDLAAQAQAEIAFPPDGN